MMIDTEGLTLADAVELYVVTRCVDREWPMSVAAAVSAVREIAPCADISSRRA